MTLCVDDNGDVLSNSIKGHNHSYTTFVVSGKFGRFQVQQIAVILQHEIQNSKTKIYIVSFQMALELGYLKGGYVNFWFCCSGFVLQDHCNLLYHQGKFIT